MLQRIAEDVWVHESEFLISNSTVVRGRDGVLLIDPGITESELDDLAHDLEHMSLPVVAAFSTHPHWDHVLWHPALGDAPRYGTATGAAIMAEFLAQPDWVGDIAEGLPPEHADEIPMELLGQLTGLPPGAAEIPWDGPRVRVIEHRGHSEGHAALLIEEARVLVAGDMLSDILVPFLDLQALRPLDDYLESLRRFEAVAKGVDAVIPGHGSVGDAARLRERLDLDRAYVQALRDGVEPDDPRVGPQAPLDWLDDIHRWQAERIAERLADPSEGGSG